MKSETRYAHVLLLILPRGGAFDEDSTTVVLVWRRTMEPAQELRIQFHRPTTTVEVAALVSLLQCVPLFRLGPRVDQLLHIEFRIFRVRDHCRNFIVSDR